MSNLTLRNWMPPFCRRAFLASFSCVALAFVGAQSPFRGSGHFCTSLTGESILPIKCRQGVMQQSVFRVGLHQLQVLDSVVGLVVIDVVDASTLRDGSMRFGPHNTMLVLPLSGPRDLNADIALFVDQRRSNRNSSRDDAEFQALQIVFASVGHGLKLTSKEG